jgi:hypothetical protein
VIELYDLQFDLVELPRDDNEAMDDAEAPAMAVTAATPAIRTPQRNNGQGVTNEQILAFLKQESCERKAADAAIIREMATIKPWADAQFKKVISNQKRFGGTIGQAFARQHPQHQIRNQLHAEEVAHKEQQNRAFAIQQTQQGVNQNAQQQQPPPPPLPPVATYERARTISPNARLADGLRNLTEFWTEHQFGTGDNKPAKDFTKDD